MFLVINFEKGSYCLHENLEDHDGDINYEESTVLELDSESAIEVSEVNEDGEATPVDIE